MKSQTPAQCSITMLAPLDLSVSHTTFHTTTSLVNLRSECDCSHLISHHTSHLLVRVLIIQYFFIYDFIMGAHEIIYDFFSYEI